MSPRTPRSTPRGKGIITPITAPVTEPPHSIEAEQSCLGGLMLDNSAWPAVSRITTEADFYRANHRLIYSTISTLATQGGPIDIVTLGEWLESQQLLEDAGGFAYLGVLARDTPSAVNVTTYARIVRTKALERKLLAATDNKDLAQIKAIITALESLATSNTATSPHFMNIRDLCSTPPAENWLIKGYLATDSLCLLFGDPGCGKSFLAIDIACHIATGRPWREQPAKQGKVLYIAGEGRNGLARRFKAWFERTEETPIGIDISTAPIQLTDPASMISLTNDIRAMPEQPALIIIDTINRNYGPGDENATADMTHAVASLDTLRTTTGAAILGLHHSGHADKSRGRGSSVLRASLDCEFAVEKFDQVVQIRCTKAKDFDHPPPLSWTFEKQALPWANEEGCPMDSAVLIPCDLQAPPPKPSTTRMGPNQTKALELLHNLHQRNHARREAAGLDTENTGVTKGDWYNAMETAGFARNRRTDAKAELVQRGLIQEDGEFIYLTEACTGLCTGLVPE